MSQDLLNANPYDSDRSGGSHTADADLVKNVVRNSIPDADEQPLIILDETQENRNADGANTRSIDPNQLSLPLTSTVSHGNPNPFSNAALENGTKDVFLTPISEETATPSPASKNDEIDVEKLTSHIPVLAKRSSTGKQMTLSWTNVNVIAANVSGKQRKGNMATHLFRSQCCGGKGTGFGGSKQILKNVSGIAYPGEIVAVMGASGAGKTTLLNVLTDRANNLIVDGGVYVNGQAVGSSIRAMSAFVQQHDLFIKSMTVREHLIFQACLRMERYISYDQRIKRVDEVIRELGLEKSQNSRIGGMMGGRGGISGGEKKRLSFASEILTNPPILFCDEPTSGLDSFMAQQIISVLKQMAASGRTVLFTIHQPSSEVFRMFDKLCLLAEGRVAYLGPAHGAAGLFESLHFPCPSNFNPADHYIRTLAVVPGKEKECKDRIRAICRGYRESKVFEVVESDILRQNKQDCVDNYADEYEWDDVLEYKNKYKAGWMAQFRTLAWRTALCTKREPMVTTVRLINTIIISVLLGLIYMGTKIRIDMLQNMRGLLFAFVTNASFSYIFPAVRVFTEELPIFLREHKSRLYRVDTYFWAKPIVELPVLVIFPLLFATILYWMADVRNDFSVYITTALIVVILANLGASLGYLTSAIGKDLATASTISPVVIVPFMLFGGFFINTSSVPVFFTWLSDLSYIKYAYEALNVNMWQGITEIPGCAPNATCLSTGLDVLHSLNMNENNLWFDIGIMIVMLVVYRILAFLCLLLRASVKGG